MRVEKPLINLGDNTKILTNPKMDLVITELNGDDLVIWKKQIPEFVTALIGAYLDDADSKGVSNLVAGIRRKLEIRKMRDGA